MYDHPRPRHPLPGHWLVGLTAPGLKLPLWRKCRREDVATEAEAVMRAARHLPPPGVQVRVCWWGLM